MGVHVHTWVVIFVWVLHGVHPGIYADLGWLSMTTQT